MLVWTDDRMMDKVLIQQQRTVFLSLLQIKPIKDDSCWEKRKQTGHIAAKNPHRKQDGFKEQLPEKESKRRERARKRRNPLS